MYNWIAVGLLFGSRLVVLQVKTDTPDDAMKVFFDYCEEHFKAKPHKPRVAKLPRLLSQHGAVQQLVGPGGE